MKNLVSLALVEKKGALEALFLLFRLILLKQHERQDCSEQSPPEHGNIQERDVQGPLGKA